MDENAGKFEKFVQSTTECTSLSTFLVKFGPVSDSIIAAFSVCTDISLILRKRSIYFQNRLLTTRSSDVRPRKKCIFSLKIPSFAVPTGLVNIFRKWNHFLVDCTLVGENWLTINKALGDTIRPGGSSPGEPFYLYYIYSKYFPLLFY
jgi:hypothetical protein